MHTRQPFLRGIEGNHLNAMLKPLLYINITLIYQFQCIPGKEKRRKRSSLHLRIININDYRWKVNEIKKKSVIAFKELA